MYSRYCFCTRCLLSSDCHTIFVLAISTVLAFQFAHSKVLFIKLIRREFLLLALHSCAMCKDRESGDWGAFASPKNLADIGKILFFVKYGFFTLIYQCCPPPLPQEKVVSRIWLCELLHEPVRCTVPRFPGRRSLLTTIKNLIYSYLQNKHNIAATLFTVNFDRLQLLVLANCYFGVSCTVLYGVFSSCLTSVPYTHGNSAVMASVV